jgi:hypothetical protein
MQSVAHALIKVFHLLDTTHEPGLKDLWFESESDALVEYFIKMHVALEVAGKSMI